MQFPVCLYKKYSEYDVQLIISKSGRKYVTCNIFLNKG